MTGRNSIASPGSMTSANPLFGVMGIANTEAGDASVLSDITIVDDDVITEALYPGVVEVTGAVDVEQCLLLETLGIEDLVEVGGTITVSTNAALVNLNVISLETVGGSLLLGDACLLLIEIDLSSLVSVVDDLVIIQADTLTTLDLSSLETVGGYFYVYSNHLLASVDFSALTTVTGDLYFDSIIGAVSFPALTSVGSEFYSEAGSTSMTSISAPSLATVGDLAGASIAIDGCLDLLTISLPSLVSVTGSLYIYNNILLTTIDLSALTDAGPDFEIYGNAALTTVTLTGLVTIGASGALFDVNSNASLATFSFPVGLTTVVAGTIEINFSGCALTQASVDNILVRLAATDVSGCDINLSSGTNATPSATGLAAKATLEAAGNTVSVN